MEPRRHGGTEESAVAAALMAVEDRESFIRFVEALAIEREAAEEMERVEHRRYDLGGALGWQNGSISAFLHACLDCFVDKPLHTAPTEPCWRAFADFLFCGKVVE